MSVRVVQFADGFTSASAPSISGAFQEDYPLLNNQSLTNIAGLIFDNSVIKSAFFSFEVERIGTSTYRQVGTFQISYNAGWVITFGNYQGDTIIEETLSSSYGITLTIDSSTGQFKYSSNNQAGHTSSEIKIYIVRVTA